MFTGIVQTVGAITHVAPLGGATDGVRLTVNAGALNLLDVALGDSVAIQGACMTVVVINTTAKALEFDVSRESLSKTVGLERAGPVNLETALSLSTKLGGHLVTGHVDGLGTVVQFAQVGESWRLDILTPQELGKFFAYKGSATVNGVSLTVNTVLDQANGTVISINLIPHTMQVTTLGTLRAGDKVNLEIDLIARYVERMLARP
jgi:riboflavin synthase